MSLHAVQLRQHPKRQSDDHYCKSQQEQHVQHMAALPLFALWTAHHLVLQMACAVCNNSKPGRRL
jgi:hypothetical protein